LRVRNAINRAQMPAPANPVTDLPEGELVDEKLTALLSKSDWTILQLSIESLSTFRERYGFVAADDVLRAVTLMVRNAVREFGDADHFVGHLSTETYLIITNPDSLDDIKDRIERRIAQSREYFYPLRDRDRAKQAMQENHLRVVSAVVAHSDGPFADIEALKTKLQSAREASSA
ncbi:MAG: diguanylate cyclase, partial [Anaerolineae bacterium]|nr:diguanylate cyclase [Anaerolineae bacterium]